MLTLCRIFSLSAAVVEFHIAELNILLLFVAADYSYQNSASSLSDLLYSIAEMEWGLNFYLT